MYDELFFFPTISYISSSSFPPPFLLFCQYYYIFIVFLVVFLKFFKFFKFFFFYFRQLSPNFANICFLSFFFLVITYCSIFVIQLVITLCPPLSSKKKRNESALLVQYTLVIMCTLQSCSQRENKNCFLQI